MRADLEACARTHPVAAALLDLHQAHRDHDAALTGTDHWITARRIVAAEQALTDALDAAGRLTFPRCRAVTRACPDCGEAFTP